MHSLVQQILGTCERVANIFLHPGANYTYMYNLHTVCKSAHVNGALDIFLSDRVLLIYLSGLTRNVSSINEKAPLCLAAFGLHLILIRYTCCSHTFVKSK